MRKFKIGQNFDTTTCRKIINPCNKSLNPCNTKKIFPEYSFHINFRKSQEISTKLNDSVKSYNKKTNRGGQISPPPPPNRNRIKPIKVLSTSLSFQKSAYQYWHIDKQISNATFFLSFISYGRK